MTGIEIAAKILSDADCIECEKDSKSLTPDEARTVTAAAFLRKIAPYLVTIK